MPLRVSAQKQGIGISEARRLFRSALRNTNIDRTDRMLRDLIDVNQIRAGKQLPLRLNQCDLAAIAREVVEELASIHGKRFFLKAEDGVRGIWSAEELRRALWNLTANAIKYGAPDKLVTIR